jgi:hypothetical protein
MAIKLCAPHAPPKMGYEVCLAPARLDNRIPGLWLQNICGVFVVTNTFTPKANWKETYGFELP